MHKTQAWRPAVLCSVHSTYEFLYPLFYVDNEVSRCNIHSKVTLIVLKLCQQPTFAMQYDGIKGLLALTNGKATLVTAICNA